jgi:hypothetical protein
MRVLLTKEDREQLSEEEKKNTNELKKLVKKVLDKSNDLSVNVLRTL